MNEIKKIIKDEYEKLPERKYKNKSTRDLVLVFLKDFDKRKDSEKDIEQLFKKYNLYRIVIEYNIMNSIENKEHKILKLETYLRDYNILYYRLFYNYELFMIMFSKELKRTLEKEYKIKITNNNQLYELYGNYIKDIIGTDSDIFHFSLDSKELSQNDLIDKLVFEEQFVKDSLKDSENDLEKEYNSILIYLSDNWLINKDIQNIINKEQYKEPFETIKYLSNGVHEFITVDDSLIENIINNSKEFGIIDPSYEYKKINDSRSFAIILNRINELMNIHEIIKKKTKYSKNKIYEYLLVIFKIYSIIINSPKELKLSGNYEYNNFKDISLYQIIIYLNQPDIKKLIKGIIKGNYMKYETYDIIKIIETISKEYTLNTKNLFNLKDYINLSENPSKDFEKLSINDELYDHIIKDVLLCNLSNDYIINFIIYLCTERFFKAKLIKDISKNPNKTYPIIYPATETNIKPCLKLFKENSSFSFDDFYSNGILSYNLIKGGSKNNVLYIFLIILFTIFIIVSIVVCLCKKYSSTNLKISSCVKTF